jgi:hypothetical protein
MGTGQDVVLDGRYPVSRIRGVGELRMNKIKMMEGGKLIKYLKLSRLPVGYLMNFVVSGKNGGGLSTCTGREAGRLLGGQGEKPYSGRAAYRRSLLLPILFLTSDVCS